MVCFLVFFPKDLIYKLGSLKKTTNKPTHTPSKKTRTTKQKNKPEGI